MIDQILDWVLHRHTVLAIITIAVVVYLLRKDPMGAPGEGENDGPKGKS